MELLKNIEIEYIQLLFGTLGMIFFAWLIPQAVDSKPFFLDLWEESQEDKRKKQ